MKKFFIFLVLTIIGLNAWAYDFSVGGIYYHYYGSGSVEVTYQTSSYNSYTGNIIIPSTVTYNETTYNVNSIGYDAFQDCSGLTSITIPNSVTYIGSNAFYGCSGLTSITIPNSVTSIGNGAFYNCSGLTSITIPNSVTYIGNGAFYNCSGLTSITIPNSVTYICSNAFYGCSGLTSITIPNSVTSIEAFAFRGCSGLTSITIPNSVTSIGNGAFYNCSGLTSITIPNSVTSIGEGAFYGCSGLTSITIPNSVTSIEEFAFRGCSGLTSINVDNNNQYYASLDGVLYTKQIDTLICCPAGKVGVFTFPNSVNSIGYGAFLGCSGLTSITIPNSVNSIGYGAFFGCSGLTSITIPNSVTSIGGGAFDRCSSLISITIPNSVTSIDEFAFRGCSGLTSITIPNSVTSIGIGAFFGCSGLTSITIPNSVTSIGDYAFYACTGLTSITIPNSVTSIGDYAFYACTGLTSIISLAIIPPLISNYTFSGLTLSSIHLYVPCGNLSAYQNADYWSDFTNISELNFINREVTICQGNLYFFAGDTLTQAGIYYDTLQSVNGCDSIVTLTLNVNPTFNDTITATIQPGETYSENGFNESQEGIYTQELQSMNSCDSIVVLVLHVEASLNTVSGKNINVALYPNPANNKTKLEVEGLDSDADITIYDIQGRVLKRMKLKESEREVNIDLTGLIKGIYQVRIVNNNFNITKKLIVN